MNKIFLCAAIAGFITALTTAVQASDNHADNEKCYGIAKMGTIICKSINGTVSCHDKAMRDNDPNDWKFVAKGECEAMGGTTEDGGSMMMMKKDNKN